MRYPKDQQPASFWIRARDWAKTCFWCQILGRIQGLKFSRQEGFYWNWFAKKVKKWTKFDTGLVREGLWGAGSNPTLHSQRLRRARWCSRQNMVEGSLMMRFSFSNSHLQNKGQKISKFALSQVNEFQLEVKYTEGKFASGQKNTAPVVLLRVEHILHVSMVLVGIYLLTLFVLVFRTKLRLGT